MFRDRAELTLFRAGTVPETVRSLLKAYLGYTFVTDFCYRFICGSLIFARFSAVGMGVGLYAGRVICEYIW